MYYLLTLMVLLEKEELEQSSMVYVPLWSPLSSPPAATGRQSRCGCRDPGVLWSLLGTSGAGHRNPAKTTTTNMSPAKTKLSPVYALPVSVSVGVRRKNGGCRGWELISLRNRIYPSLPAE